MKAAEYAVVEEEGDREALEARVRALIAEGWQPLGGLAVARVPGWDGPQTLYAQAMVRVAG